VGPHGAALQEKLAAFLAWEKRKRWEFILTSLVCYALAGALALVPLLAQLPSGIGMLWLPLALAVVLAPWLFIKTRWIGRDNVRSLAQLDKTLRLDERTVTAWDLLARQETSAGAQLVIQQAADRLSALEPKQSFPRRWSWQAYSVLPLACIWLALLWFQTGTPAARLRVAPTLAEKLKEFARELREKARSEGLKESLQAGKEIEKLAQQELDKNRGEEQLKKDLAGVTQKLAAAAQQTAQPASLPAAENEQSLRDLKAELEAARDWLNAPPDAQGARAPEAWLDRLAALPQLNRQLGKQDGGGQSMSQRDAKSLLEKLDQQVSAELDRRTLLDAQEFLRQMMQQGTGERGETNARATGREQSGAADDGEKGPSQSNLPGSEPGKKTAAAPALPQFPAGPSTQVKALIGEGASSGIEFKGKPAPGKSLLSQQEAVASYRRQAEQDLNSERVPEALKETIRNYFLSLDDKK
jgi:hypothetical protein